MTTHVCIIDVWGAGVSYCIKCISIVYDAMASVRVMHGIPLMQFYFVMYFYSVLLIMDRTVLL